MDKLNFQEKQTGDILEASEWNQTVSKIDELVEASNNGGGNGGGTPAAIDASGVVSINNKGNVTIGSNNIKNVNIEPGYPYSQDNTKYGDIALKPGDDIQFASHHREPKKRDKIVVKNIDGSDNPVKLQIVAGEIDLAVGTENNPKTATKKKDKNTGDDIADPLFKADDAKVMDLRILTGNILDEGTNNERDERAYLKVRAQAIDLRCEKHGGVALQPKGYDSDGNMNKIKFEHGGGDGLEFGTFNPEKSSLYTDEYRFKRDGIWKMATRQTTPNAKAIFDDNTPVGKTSTAALKYVKQNDDFYDIIDANDEQCTTKDIIKTAAALNNNHISSKLSSNGNLSIGAISTYRIVPYKHEIIDPGSVSFNTEDPSNVFMNYDPTFNVDITRSYFREELKLILSGTKKLSDYCGTNLPFGVEGQTGLLFEIDGDVTPKISIESEEEVDIDAKYGDVVITSGDSVKIEAPEVRLNAINDDKTGGKVNFGATQDVVFLTNKLTAGMNVESATNPTSIKLQLQNNSAQSVFWDSTNGVFRVPLTNLYIDANHTTKLSATNFVGETPVYFEDGTLVPADFTCFIGDISESGGVYTTNIYKTGTKGSSAILKKKLGDVVAVYTSASANSLGTMQSNTIQNMEFELPTYTAGAGVSEVASEEFVTIANVEVVDIITLVNYFKTGVGKSQGPWANS